MYVSHNIFVHSCVCVVMDNFFIFQNDDAATLYAGMEMERKQKQDPSCDSTTRNIRQTFLKDFLTSLETLQNIKIAATTTECTAFRCNFFSSFTDGIQEVRKLRQLVATVVTMDPPPLVSNNSFSLSAWHSLSPVNPFIKQWNPHICLFNMCTIYCYYKSHIIGTLSRCRFFDHPI